MDLKTGGQLAQLERAKHQIVHDHVPAKDPEVAELDPWQRFTRLGSRVIAADKHPKAESAGGSIRHT